MSNAEHSDDTYWKVIWTQFRHRRIGYAALWILGIFVLIGLYAPFLASSKPFVVIYDGQLYFPLFRYLFYPGFFTKAIDIFYNLLMFTFPATLILCLIFRKRKTQIILFMALLQPLIFFWILYMQPKDPAISPELEFKRQEFIQNRGSSSVRMSWNQELLYHNSYARLNLVLKEILDKRQNEELIGAIPQEAFKDKPLPSLWQIEKEQEEEQIKQLQMKVQQTSNKTSQSYLELQARLQFLIDRQKWIEEQTEKIGFMVMPPLRPYHWEDDAGGSQALNQVVDWWELTRINHKDLVAALIFGIRVSIMVGVTAVIFALLIGVPIGAIAGYFGGKTDLVICRFMEIWESMPTFFMLLLVVAVMQTKSIFLIVAVLGIFGWINIARFMRGEVLKQRNLTYVEACQAMGFRRRRIIFSHMMPNAIPPVLTLLPFAIMAAIVSEAGLSFLGLGEEGSSSLGVLMDEGRTAFPGESYLLWPPAIILTVLLITIALVGDAMRDALDPKLRQN